MHIKITTVILTLNEEIHIERCMLNAERYSQRVIVIDSYSCDQTKKLVKNRGHEFYQNKFKTQSQQFNWGLDNINFDQNELIIKLDADEYFDETAVKAIESYSKVGLSRNTGIAFNRMIKFQGDLVKFGGLKNKWIVRGFISGYGRSDNRLMDEHLKVDGTIIKSDGFLIDECLKGIKYWKQKHLEYANREASEQLINAQNQNLLRKLYYFVPSYMRPYFYFIFRYIILGGFKDQRNARRFHYLQALWYRKEVERSIKKIKSLSKEAKYKFIMKYK
jgi:hypothetical protein